MSTLIDTSVWIDLTRARSPKARKEFLAPYVLEPEAHIADLIRFELLRHATKEEIRQLSRYFDTYPVLVTPPDLWREATRLGQACRASGHTPGSMDLLIAWIAIHHDAELVTLDAGFQRIAEVAPLRVTILQPPT